MDPKTIELGANKIQSNSEEVLESFMALNNFSPSDSVFMDTVTDRE